MKQIAILFVLLLLAVSVHAYDDPVKTAQYLVVVGKTAPASDVIIAANFAASMKGSAAVTFQSAIDEDLRAKLSLGDLHSKTVVVVNGGKKTVRILGGLHDDAWDNSREYFRRLGFVVAEVDSGYTLDDLLLTPPEVPTPVVAPPPALEPAPVELNETKNDTLKETPKENPVLENKTEKPKPTPEQLAEQNPTIAPEPPKQGFFVRVWSWFASLF